jgi:hypothetical protein
MDSWLTVVELEWLSRTLVAFALATTGYSKLRRLPDFVADAIGYNIGPPSLVRRVALAIPFVELGLAGAILFGRGVRPAAALTACLLGAFLAMTLFNLARGHRVPCGCGFAASERIGLSTILHQLVLLAPSLWLALGLPATGLQISDLDLPSAAHLAVVSALCVALLASVSPITSVARVALATRRLRQQPERRRLPQHGRLS